MKFQNSVVLSEVGRRKTLKSARERFGIKVAQTTRFETTRFGNSQDVMSFDARRSVVGHCGTETPRN